MLARNLSRLSKIEFKRGDPDLLQGEAWSLPDGRVRVMGLGNDELSGIFNENEYEAMAAREDVFIVRFVVRGKVE